MIRELLTLLVEMLRPKSDEADQLLELDPETQTPDDGLWPWERP